MRGQQVKIRQGKLAARRRRRVILLTLYAAAAAGLFICLLSFLTQLGLVSIDRIDVEGNSRLSSTTVDAVALKELAGNYVGLFSRRNIFLYPRQAIQRDVLALPLVKTAAVSRSGLRAIAVSVTERVQAARWCSGGFGDTLNCASIDNDGYIFAKISRASPGLSSSGDSFIYRTATSGDPIGSSVVEPVEFKKISFFISELAGLSVDPREASIAPSGYMTIALGMGGKLVINTADDLSIVLGNIASVISDKAVAPSLNQFLGSLDYMKLDVGNKVVYKLKK